MRTSLQKDFGSNIFYTIIILHIFSRKMDYKSDIFPLTGNNIEDFHS